MKTVTADWISKLIVTYNYRKDGLLSEEIYGNGIKTTYTYDAAGRLTSKKISKSDNTVIVQYDFELDKSGNIVKETSTGSLFTGFELPTQTPKDNVYAYNANNNRITSVSGNENFSFVFDANGNTTTKTGKTFAYDINDMLIGVTSTGFNATYKYDAQGNRREATRNGITTRYVLDIQGLSKVLVETNGSNAPVYFYIHGLGLAARIKASDNSVQYYSYDYRGSTVAITDANQNFLNRYHYDEFGNAAKISETAYNEYRYVGQYGVGYESTDLQFMRARFYDPQIGRFLSEDPIWNNSNLYPYAGNNAVMNIDFTGLKSKKADPWAGMNTTGVDVSKYNPSLFYCGTGAVSNPADRSLKERIIVSQKANRSCFIHDEQYSILGRSKIATDIAFKNNVLIELIKNGYKLDDALIIADYYYEGVLNFGNEPYLSAQSYAAYLKKPIKLNNKLKLKIYFDANFKF